MPRSQSTHDTIRAAVLEVLGRGGEHSTVQLATATGHDVEQVRHAIRMLETRRQVLRVRGRKGVASVWTMPEPPTASRVAGPPYIREGRYRTALNNVYSNGGGFSTRVRGGWVW